MNTEFSFRYVVDSIFADSAINPVKILVLFISMTVLSVFLDEVGFFRYLANATLKKSGQSQKKLFVFLYVIVSVLTVFTSNDIIVLTFTPFICYFASNAGIKPLPYLVTVFVAANTWSMALIIGNPTNIYLATYGGISFFDYLVKMILPTFAAGSVSFVLLYLCFKKDLAVPMKRLSGRAGHITDIVLLFIGLGHLVCATVLLAVGSWINIEMWFVALMSVSSLFLFNLLYALVKRRKPYELGRCLKRAPWTLVPFLLTMFVLILFLRSLGVPGFINGLLGKKFVVFKYGYSSLLSCNVINNIPMSVLFCSVTETLPEALKGPALFATIIGSNIGAFLTPIGALAGVMWRKILGNQGIKFGYRDFLNYGIKIGLPSITAALIVLNFI